MNQDLMPHEPQPVAQATPSQLIQYAMQTNTPIEKLEQLFELQLRYEANEARKAYVQAMVEFKRNPPEIFKTSHVKFGNTEYDHATIGDVASITSAALAAHGISHRWDMTQGDKGIITVRCILTHAMGHSESVELSSGADQSGGKNNIQAVASTVTYLQRYTLLAAAGLATQDMPDDDGRQGKKPKEESAITGKRKTELGDTADLIRQAIADDKDWDAFGLYEPITDSEEKLFIWPLLPSNCRSALKRCAAEKDKLSKAGHEVNRETA